MWSLIAPLCLLSAQQIIKVLVFLTFFMLDLKYIGKYDAGHWEN